MKFDDIKFTLKDGREAILRSPIEEDVQGTLDYLYKSAGETEFILRYPEECKAKYTYDSEKAFFERISASPDDAFFNCIVDGTIVGNCHIAFMTNMKTRHRATIGIAILKDYWNQGIGSEMFRAMIKAAENHEGTTQIELAFIEGNSRGRALYEKFGFRIVNMLPDAIRLKDGSFRNEYFMIKKL